MKLKTIFLLIIFWFPFIATAEYNGHHIEFSIELKDGKEIHGYQYLASVYRKDKSTTYKEFLEKNYNILLKNQFIDGFGEMTYFRNRIKYNYKDYSGFENYIFTLMDKKEINLEQIKSLKIISMEDFTYLTVVSSSHKWEDRNWMKSEPVKRFSTGGIFCSHDVFVHEENTNVDKIIKELDEVYKNFEKQKKEQEEEMENSDGEPFYQAKEKIEQLEEEIDGKINDVLQKIKSSKVVIISNCTC